MLAVQFLEEDESGLAREILINIDIPSTRDAPVQLQIEIKVIVNLMSDHLKFFRSPDRDDRT